MPTRQEAELNLQVDCHSQEEYSVKLDTQVSRPTVKRRQQALFLFACFALRNLSNNQGHMVGDALAGLLDLLPFSLYLSGSAAGLLLRKQWHELVAGGLTEAEADARYAAAVSQSHQKRPGTQAEYLEKEFLSRLQGVKLSTVKREAKKRFVMTVPPLVFDMKGFGTLFGDVRYHSFMSTVAVGKFIIGLEGEDKYWPNEVGRMGSACARAYYGGGIPIDQARLAADIVPNAL